MNFLSLYYDKLCLKQWNIGYFKGRLTDVISDGKISSQIQWLPLKNDFHFLADPFILDVSNGVIQILAEEFNDYEGKGKISLITIQDNKITDTKVVYELCKHLSYPCVFKESGKTYVIPESSKAGRVDLLEYDFKFNSLVKVRTLLTLPLLDSTIIKYYGRYYLFGYSINKKGYELIIYHANSLMDEFVMHPESGKVSKENINRPAGNFFQINHNWYRPAQRSTHHYGQSIIINRIKYLDEARYEEEIITELLPGEKGKYNYGMHTINECNGYIVIDGLTRNFKPFYKLKRFIKKKFIKKDPTIKLSGEQINWDKSASTN